MTHRENGKPRLWKRMALRLADLDVHIRGDRWRPLVRWLYRLLAPFYDWGAARFMPDYRQAARSLLDAVDAGRDDTLLDLGCGTGMVTIPAATRVNIAAGIDMTPAMLRQARQKQRDGRPALLRGDVRHLPFAPSSFTVVTTSFMLLHLTDAEKRRTFAESARILAPGGRFGALTGREQTTSVYPDPAQWRTWLEEAGFDHVTITEWGDAYRLVLATTSRSHPDR